EAHRAFSLAEVAEMVGRSLSRWLKAKGQDSIFTETNRRWVARICTEVGRNLARQALAERPLRLKIEDLQTLVEKTLVDNNAYDVARSLVSERRDRPVAIAAAGDTPVCTARLIRRQGQVVPWNEAKIEIAVCQAFLALRMDASAAPEIARAVTGRVMELGQATVHIEEVQDLVQEELMRAGHYKVAERYIIYRAMRTEQRERKARGDEAESTEGHAEGMVVVTHADGSTFLWDGADLQARIEFASIGLDLCLGSGEIEKELRRSVFDGIKRTDLNNTISLNAKTLIEKDADFAKFAGRIQLSFIYEEVLGWDILRDGVGALRDFHRKKFREAIQRGTDIQRYSTDLQKYDLDKMAAALDPLADLELDFLGVQTLYDRYLIVDKKAEVSRRLETPQFFWMRVSMGLFHAEPKDREVRAIELYNLYKSRRFCSSTPTLFNSGTRHSQLSSCYLYWVDDSIEGIMQRGVAENAMLSKWAGGLGGSWTSVRGTGSYIGGTNGESQGVIPFLKLHNDLLVAVNQGGKRKGSGCAYLETWHNDLFDFLELRKNTGDDRRRCHDMNTANWIPDLFMKRMEAREDWTFFRASEASDLHHLYGKKFEERYTAYEKMADKGEIWGQKIPAIEVWKRMLSMLFETGHPWITFKDACNVRSPQDHAGVIHSSNLCTEITLNTGKDETAVCNLGSIILDTHLKADGSLDLPKLRETVRVAVRALDNVIDINFYPTEAAKTANMRHRPIGLGVMGLQNALYMKGLSFASEGAVEFNDEMMEAIAYYAYEASSDLAQEKGTYSSYRGSKWDRGLMPQDTLDLLEQERGVPVEVPRGGRMDWHPLREKIRAHGMRNSNVLAIAPTATISNITGTSPCIEPTYKNLFVKSNLSGEFIVLNPFLVKDLKKAGLWNQQMVDQLKYFDGELGPVEGMPEELKKRYLTAFAVGFEWIMAAAARRQKWIDQSQSLNLFLGQPDLKVLSRMYRLAWHQGLKTTYYLRTLGASNIEKATVKLKKEVKAALQEGEAPAEEGKKTYTAEQKMACSIEAMRNGGECEACQ
ncbi:ribonucleoside-diphosphate reductase subunit alpha, partial [bacterium]|nr:ribonucleoside-diphosphate reductase subunit alpha [bacterium]